MVIGLPAARPLRRTADEGPVARDVQVVDREDDLLLQFLLDRVQRHLAVTHENDLRGLVLHEAATDFGADTSARAGDADDLVFVMRFWVGHQ